MIFPKGQCNIIVHTEETCVGCVRNCVCIKNLGAASTVKEC